MKTKSPLHVTYITTGLGTGGAEMMLAQLVAGIRRDRFEQSVISLTEGGKHEATIRALGVPVHSLAMSPGKPSIGALVRLAKIVRKLQPDVLVGWMYHGDLAASLAKIMLCRRVPVIWNVRQSLYSLSFEKRGSAAVIRLLAKLSGWADCIAYNSEISARQHEEIGYRKERTVFIANGYNTTSFVPSEEAKLSVRAELGLPSDALLVGRFGRFAAMKDFGSFIEAAALVRDAMPDVHYVLVGTGVDTKNGEIMTQIEERGLSTNMHVLGERADMPRITASLDVACSSSAFGEGFPNVIGEAMSCAVPCVATDVGDSAWVIGNTGRIVPAKSPSDLATGLLSVLKLSAEERKALGEDARNRVLESFSLSSVVRRYEELYLKYGKQGMGQLEEKACVA